MGGFQKTTRGGITLELKTDPEDFQNVIITISGLPGSGTTTATELLSEKTKMDIISSGEVFRRMAKERDKTLQEFSDLAEKDEKIDKELDQRMVNLAEEGKILEGRLTGHLLNDSEKSAFKIWLEAPSEVRVNRIAEREGDHNNLKERVMKREKSEIKRYKQYYDIDLMDKSIYDLVIDSEKYSPEEIVTKILEVLNDEIR